MTLASLTALVVAAFPLVAPEVAEVGIPDGVELVGQTSHGDLTWGWAGRRVFQRADRGGAWLPVGRLPLRIDRLAAADSHRLIARFETQFFVSQNAGRTWESTAALDVRSDWTRLTGESAGLQPHEHLACVLNGDSRLEVSYDAIGCLGGTERSLVVEIGALSGRLTISPSRWAHTRQTRSPPSILRAEWAPQVVRFEPGSEIPPPAADERLARDEAEALVRQFVSAATRTELHSTCATVAVRAKIRWTCGAWPPAEASFTSYDCEAIAELFDAKTTRGRGVEQAYSRAGGVRRLAKALVSKYVGSR